MNRGEAKLRGIERSELDAGQHAQLDGDAASAPPRVLIVANRTMRAGIRLALGVEFAVCAEATDAAEAIRSAMREQPDVCLVSREVLGGFSALRGIRRAAPGVAVVVLSEACDTEDLLDCIRSGAVGYVPGPLDADWLRAVVRATASGEAVVPRSMVLELVRELQTDGGAGEALTARESQVLSMLRRGHGTATIAHRLKISPVTVRRHISGLTRKLGVEDRTALLAHARGI